MQTDKLGQLARAQCGVFARRQAVALGYGYSVITRKLETKQWCRVMGSVYAAATTQLDQRSLEWAAYLACGPGAVLCGPSALRRHGIDAGPARETREPVHWVTVPAERHVTFRGVRTIREAVPPDDIVVVDGMRATSLARSVVDTLRVLPDVTGRSLLDRALLRGWITMDDLEQRTHALVGRRGIGRLRIHLARVRSGARSEAERRLHDVLGVGGVTGWTANVKVVADDGTLVAILDVAFPDAKVALEVDGLAFHTDPEAFQRDRTRQNWLVNHGWTVLRFTWDDLTQRRPHVLRVVRAALGHPPTPKI